MSFIPSDGEGRRSSSVDEAVTRLVSLDDGNHVTFNSIFDIRGSLVEDSSRSRTRLEVADGIAFSDVSALTSGGSAVSARLLGAGSRGFVLDENTLRIGSAHQWASRVSAERTGSVVVGVAENLLTASLSGSIEFTTKFRRASGLSLAVAEFLVSASGGESASRVGIAVRLRLTLADIFRAGGGDGREVEVAVRHRLAHEGIENPEATDIALVVGAVPTAFSGGSALSLSGVVTALGSDSREDITVGAVRANEINRTVRPSRRIGILADVGLRARIVAWASSPVAEGTEADVGESRKGRRFTEERVFTDRFPVAELTIGRLATLKSGVTIPEGSVGFVVRPDPLTFSIDIITTNPTEGEELSADDVGFGSGGDSGEAARSAVEGAGFANGACAPPVDGTVGASEVEHLLSLGGEDVASTDVPVDGTSGSGDGGGEEDDVTEDGNNLLRVEALGVSRSNDTEFTLVVVEGVVEGSRGTNKAKEIDLLGVSRFNSDQDGTSFE